MPGSLEANPARRACQYEPYMMTAAEPPPAMMAGACLRSTSEATIMKAADCTRPMWTHLKRVSERVSALISAVWGDEHAAAMIS